MENNQEVRNPDGTFAKGNQFAAQKPFHKALQRAIAQDDGKLLRAAADKLLAKAAEGDTAATKELADRLDGKPAQGVTVAGDATNPVNVSLRVLFGRG